MKNGSLYIISIWLLLLAVSLHALTRNRLDYLLSEIKSDDETRCSKAAIKLAEYGPEAKAAIPVLIEIVQNQEMNVYASGVLPYISTEEPIEKILQLAKDENAFIQSIAIECLKYREIDKEKALKIYTKLLNHDNPWIAVEAAEAMNKVGAGSLCLDKVLQLARDDETVIVSIALTIIGEIGIANEQVKRVLVDCFSINDKREVAKVAAIYQNLYSDERKGITQLEVLAKDADKNVRWHAAKAIGNVKKSDSQTKQLSRELINDDNIQVAIWSCYAMIQHDVEKEQAWKLIIDSLNSSDFIGRISALSVLRELGPLAKNQQERMLKIIDDRDELIQTLAIGTLGEIQPSSKELVLPALKNKLKTTNSFLVWNVAKRTIEQIETAHED